ncbi:hypothetical protein [Rhizobium brockwellii]|uniref:hypothetical protein n=1 Tax=Rhizobium brockwellii TaxID=3019932 RepID=UPI003F97C04B
MARYPLRRAAVRRVRPNGEIKWSGDLIYIAQGLAGEPVAVEETEDGQWVVRFYAHPLGVIDPIHGKLRRCGFNCAGTVTYVSGSICHPSFSWTRRMGVSGKAANALNASEE